jgi:hypothetical protein
MLLAYSEAARGLCLSALSISGTGDGGATAVCLAVWSARECSKELRLAPACLDGCTSFERRAAAVALGSRGRRDV